MHALILGLSLLTATMAQAVDDPRRTPVVAAVERATPAVVTIEVEVETTSPFMMFGGRQSTRSEGSGVIIRSDGVVLTNAHVVDGARRIQVHLQDERSFSATVVAADPAIDLAVIQLLDAVGLPVISLGVSDDLLLGEPAIAIGNPYGLGLTVSTGVVASTGRDVNVGDGPLQTYIQTDAAINPGNSGGALVNIYGELIGINTFIHSSAEGVGFAIPVNRVRKISSDLLAHGSVQIPWLGLGVRDVTVGRRRAAVFIERVHASGPGARAGVEAGDLLLEVDGHAVANRSDLNARLAERAVGEPVSVRLQRNGAVQDLTIRGQRAPEDLGTKAMGVLGITVSPYRNALQVASVRSGGTWAAARLQQGDVIVQVDGKPVATQAELSMALGRAAARHRNQVFVYVVRGRYAGSVVVGL